MARSARQFVVRQVGAVGLLMPPDQHLGTTRGIPDDLCNRASRGTYLKWIFFDRAACPWQTWFRGLTIEGCSHRKEQESKMSGPYLDPSNINLAAILPAQIEIAFGE